MKPLIKNTHRNNIHFFIFIIINFILLMIAECLDDITILLYYIPFGFIFFGWFRRVRARSVKDMTDDLLQDEWQTCWHKHDIDGSSRILNRSLYKHKHDENI